MGALKHSRAAVVEAVGEAPHVEDIELADLRLDEVLVRVLATGVCHTDIAWSDGEIFDAFPVVLGHESAGVVEAVGPQVQRVAPGDRVVLSLTHHCGHCKFCESGRPILCGERELARPRLLRRGQPLVQGYGTGGFAEHAIVKEVSTVVLPSDVTMDVGAIIGCAASTGLGAVFNIAEVEYGSQVAILGAGGVGLSALMGCVVAGAERIVVADPDKARRDLAASLGATEVIEPDEELFRELVPSGFEYVFECSSDTRVMELAVQLTERGGTTVLIGNPPRAAEICINARDFIPKQLRLLGCLTGNVRPDVDFDRYFRLFRRGKLPLDKLVTATVAFRDIAKAFELSRERDGIRTIVQMGVE